MGIDMVVIGALFSWMRAKRACWIDAYDYSENFPINSMDMASCEGI